MYNQKATTNTGFAAGLFAQLGNSHKKSNVS
jgi:hypothetical protein